MNNNRKSLFPFQEEWSWLTGSFQTSEWEIQFETKVEVKKRGWGEEQDDSGVGDLNLLGPRNSAG